jgi:MSHA biogenesis protein MshG
MLNAGMPITRAFQSVQKKGRYGQLFEKIQAQITAGHGLTEIIEQHPRRFNKLDQTLISVGEQTGQMAEMFEMLSEWYSFRQRLKRNIQSGMLYPVLMIHALAFIGPVVPFALGGFDGSLYFSAMLGILALFYVPAIVIAAIILLLPKQGMLRWLLDSFLIRLPLLGRAVCELELSRYAKIFAITYKAGVPILRCAQMATDAVVNRVMHNRLAGGFEFARRGGDMSAGFSASLPAEFISVWQVGEQSGELDNAAWRLANLHAENAQMRFTLISQWAPRLVYAVVASVMIYYIFKGYSQIYGNLSL